MLLRDGAWYTYEPAWVDEPDSLFAALMAEHSWEERTIWARDKPVLQPRLVSWSGELPYKYSGQTLEPRPWTGALATLVGRLRDELDVPFNHAVLNLYRDGRDRVAMHADNEPELGRDPVIASVSLGAERRFVIEHKGRRRKKTLRLAHGSLLVMGGSFQHRWRHAVPGDTRVKEPRINVTVRVLKGPPGWREWSG